MLHRILNPFPVLLQFTRSKTRCKPVEHRSLPTVVSSIRYAIVVYGGCGVTQMSRLQRLINFGARVVSGKRKYDHVSEVLKELRWLSAENPASV